MKKISIPDDLKQLSKFFSDNNFQVFLVGGAVRDSILKKNPKDWDIATDATPEEMQKIFHKTIPTGIEHGTITIVFKGNMIEATTFRSESGYTDGRHPDGVCFSKSIYEDLSRRDFTMNAIAASLPNGEIIDPYLGIDDIKNKIIKTVGNPKERFLEDALRPLRGIRFASQLQFSFEKETKNALSFVLEHSDKLAKERIREEFSKILLSDIPSIGFKLMEESGYLRKFLPELASCRGVIQKGFHHFDVLDHLFYSCDGVNKKSLVVRLAALFHDVGKPLVKKESIEKERSTFYGHENVSSKITEDVLTRLCYPNQTIKDVSALIQLHMFHYETNWSDSAVRRFLSKVTCFTRVDAGAKFSGTERTLDDVLYDLFELRKGDLFGMERKSVISESLIAFKDRIKEIRNQQSVFSIKDLSISGKELIASGIPSGKQLGIVLQELLNTVLSDPNMNTPEKLINLAKNFYEQIQIK